MDKDDLNFEKMSMDSIAKIRLVHGLKMLKLGIECLLGAYEQYPELSDQADISQVVPGPLDEWCTEVDAKIYEIENEQ